MGLTHFLAADYMEDILSDRIPERLKTWCFPDSSEQDSIANTRATNLRTLRFGILSSQMTTWKSISLPSIASLHTANNQDLQFLAWFAFPHLSELIINGR